MLLRKPPHSLLLLLQKERTAGAAAAQQVAEDEQQRGLGAEGPQDMEKPLHIPQLEGTLVKHQSIPARQASSFCLNSSRNKELITSQASPPPLPTWGSSKDGWEAPPYTKLKSLSPQLPSICEDYGFWEKSD